MAGEWIKFRTDLATDPAVIRLGVVLGLDTFAVLGRLAAVWVWADTHADRHGHVTLVSRECLDSITQCADFGAALVSVGWLESSAAECGGVTFPKFERHMGKGAKERAQASKRKKSQRERESLFRHAPVPKVSRTLRDESVTREEKRREEKKEEDKTPQPPAEPGGSASEPEPKTASERKPKPGAASVPVPAALDTSEFRAVWADWLADRRDRRKPVTERAAQQQLANLAAVGPVAAAACVRASIANGWAGLFLEKAETRSAVPFRAHGGKRTTDDVIAEAMAAAVARAAAEVANPEPA